MKRIARIPRQALLLALGVIVGAVVVSGTMDYDDAVAYQGYYCERVSEGAWPNYKQLDCGDGQ